MKTIIRYNKKHLVTALALGTLTTLLCLLSVFFGGRELIALLPMGALGIANGIYKWKSGYLAIAPHKFRVNVLFSSKIIETDEIRKVYKFAGDWIAKYGKDKEVVIALHLLDLESAEKAETYFSKLATA